MRALRAEARAAVERFRYRGSAAQMWDEWMAGDEDAERAAFRRYVDRLLYAGFRMRMEPVEHDLIEGAGTGVPLGFFSARQGQTEAHWGAVIKPAKDDLAERIARDLNLDG